MGSNKPMCGRRLCSVEKKNLNVWNVPHHTHSFLLAPLGGSLPLRDELSWHSVNFIRS